MIFKKDLISILENIMTMASKYIDKNEDINFNSDHGPHAGLNAFIR